MSKNRFSARRIAMNAVLIAVYFALSYLSAELSGVKISFEALPVTLAAVLFGPIDGMLAGLLGELLTQILKYGVTATTALWILPPALRGLLIGFGTLLFFKKTGVRAFAEHKKTAAYFAVCAFAAVLTSLGNTMVYYLDSVIYGYYQYALIFGVALIRIGVNVLFSILMAIAAIPVMLALSKAGLTAPRPKTDV